MPPDVQSPSGGAARVSVALEADYAHMFRLAELTPRHKEAIQSFFGLQAMGPVTLQETGDAVQLTRERVRQVTDSFASTLRRLPFELFPAVRLAADRLVAKGPRLVGEVGAWLLSQHLTRTGVSGEGFLKLLNYWNVRIPPQLRLLPGGGGKRDRAMMQAVGKIVRTLSGSYGAVTHAMVLTAWERSRKDGLTQSELVCILAQLQGPSVVHGEWVRLAGSKRDRLADVLRKIGSLGRKYSTQELSGAWLKVLRRASTPHAFDLPPDVMEAIVRSNPDWREGPDGLWFSVVPGPEPKNQIEARIIKTLNDGEIASRAKILQRLQALGHTYKPSHVSLYLSSSPLLTRSKAGYKLLGAP